MEFATSPKSSAEQHVKKIEEYMCKSLPKVLDEGERLPYYGFIYSKKPELYEMVEGKFHRVVARLQT